MLVENKEPHNSISPYIAGSNKVYGPDQRDGFSVRSKLPHIPYARCFRLRPASRGNYVVLKSGHHLV